VVKSSLKNRSGNFRKFPENRIFSGNFPEEISGLTTLPTAQRSRGDWLAARRSDQCAAPAANHQPPTNHRYAAICCEGISTT